jgi:threonine/homoserine/homoserine lactone efflux protein
MLQALAKGITLGLLLAISVGPIVFTVIKQSLNNGVRGGMAFIFGIFMSDVFLVFCANAFTEFFTGLKAYTQWFAIIGSVLLMAVGIYFLFFKKIKVNEDGEQLLQFRKRDYAKMFIGGIIMNLLNPGIIVFWLTTATAFIDQSLNQRMMIFGTALLLALSADVVKVVLANSIRRRLTPTVIHRVNRINGLILLGFGIVLLVGAVFYNNTGGH